MPDIVFHPTEVVAEALSTFYVLFSNYSPTESMLGFTGT